MKNSMIGILLVVFLLLNVNNASAQSDKALNLYTQGDVTKEYSAGSTWIYDIKTISAITAGATYAFKVSACTGSFSGSDGSYIVTIQYFDADSQQVGYEEQYFQDDVGSFIEFTSPAGASSMKIFFIAASQTAATSDGTAIWSGIELYEKSSINDEFIDVLASEDESVIEGFSRIITRDSIVYGTSLDLTVPNIKSYYSIAFVGQFEGAFPGLEIAYGLTYPNASSYITIDEKELNTYEYTDSEQLVNTSAHGLTFVDYVDVIIAVNDDFTADITVSTRGGSYTKAGVEWIGCKGAVQAMPIDDSGTMINCKLSHSCNRYTASVWAFGDSYFDMWPGFLNDLNPAWLLDGYLGRNTKDAFASLNMCLAHGTPKYILWAMGMNDPDEESDIDADWKMYTEKFLELCDSKNITPILCTIPNTPVCNHTFKNAYIIASGRRYIDVCNAVGADISPSWFSGMLSSDNVHPTPEGGKAIADRIIAEMPEILEK